MKLYLNVLAPWERKHEYLHHIQLGKDLRTQTDLLHTSLSKQLQLQISSVNSIVASQERINDGIGNLSIGLDRISGGIESLKSSFEWGISEVVWQIEQNREVLKNILEVLMAPLDTQAKELRRRAEEAYSNGWHDDALEDFLKSEQTNKYDFSVHISIGMIYLFHIVDKNRALEYFDKAIKYAKPKSPYHASYALLYKGLIMRDSGLLPDAEDCTEQAIIITPELVEAHYQNAQYNAQIGNIDKSMNRLAYAIRQDSGYIIKVSSDSMFDPARSKLLRLMEELMDELSKKTLTTLTNLKRAVNSINTIVKNCDAFDADRFDCMNFGSDFSNIDNVLSRNSYFDSLSAGQELSALAPRISAYHKEATSWLSRQITSMRGSLAKMAEEVQEKGERAKRTVKFAIVSIIILLHIIIAWAALAENIEEYGVRETIYTAILISPLIAICAAITIGICSAIGCVLYIIFGNIAKELVRGAASKRRIGLKSRLSDKIEKYSDYLNQIKGISGL